MTDARDLSRFSQSACLRDGTPVLIRAIRPDDVGRVVEAFHKLDPQSVYTRFFAYRKELSAAELGRLGGADFVHAVVLVVSVGSGADEKLIGGGSYSVREAADGAKVAEVSFTVEEDYQGQGLAGRLLALLADMARGQGIARFEADVLATNAPMLAVFQRSGLPLTKASDDGVVRVLLDLADQPAGAPATEPGASE